MNIINKKLIKNTKQKLKLTLKVLVILILFSLTFSCTSTVQFEKDYFENTNGKNQLNNIFTGYYKVDIYPDKYLVCIQENPLNNLSIHIFDFNSANSSSSKSLNLSILKTGPYFLGKLNESGSDIFYNFLFKFSTNDIETNILFFDLNPEIFVSLINSGELKGIIIDDNKAKNGIKRKIIIQSSFDEFEKYVIDHNQEIENIINEKTKPIRFRRINWTE